MFLFIFVSMGESADSNLGLQLELPRIAPYASETAVSWLGHKRRTRIPIPDSTESWLCHRHQQILNYQIHALGANILRILQPSILPYSISLPRHPLGLDFFIKICYACSRLSIFDNCKLTYLGERNGCKVNVKHGLADW